MFKENTIGKFTTCRWSGAKTNTGSSFCDEPAVAFRYGRTVTGVLVKTPVCVLHQELVESA